LEPDIESGIDKLAVAIDTAQHPWMATAITAAAIVVALLLVHLFANAVLSRVTRRAPFLNTLVRRVRSPLAVVLPVLGVDILFGATPDDLPLIGLARQLANILLIVALTWTGLRVVRAIGEAVMSNLGNGDSPNVYHQRRVHTQTRVLTRILSFVVVLLGFSAVLMTFPGVRQIGASMLASAGLAGIVIGFAAKPVLSNLLAGLQIALTQPIRIDDVVIVENEWGWIEQINSTYVIVRIWDQRRLVVPLNYFIEHPFQNWTRDSSELIGSVFWWVDYRIPIEPLRVELERLCKLAPEWDGRLHMIQVVESSDKAIQLRALVSAPDAPQAWDLRCRIREGMIDFIQREYPDYLPRVRSSDANPAGRTASISEGFVDDGSG